MKKITILILVLFVPSVYSEEKIKFLDSGIDSYMLESHDSTVMLLKGKEANPDLGFNTYEFKLGGTHTIQFIVHPGNLKYEVSEIKIIKGQNNHLKYTYPGKAITQKGISIGISKSELINKLGIPLLKKSNQLVYRTEYNKAILVKYNMPIYYGKYKFEKNKLVSFSFGFEYP